MKHLKKLESVQGYPTRGFPIEVTIVDFSMGSDGVTALYINSDLHKYGDEYHNDIGSWIRGFIDGLKWSGINVVEEIIRSKSEYWCQQTSEYGCPPPNQLEDIYKDGQMNELFRSLRFEDESDVYEILYYLENNKYDNLEFSESKGSTKQNIKTFTFIADKDIIRIEMESWLKFTTPGSSEYNLYVNSKKFKCSQKSCKLLYNRAKEAYNKI